MRTQFKQLIIVSSLLFATFLPSASWARTVLQEIQETGVIKVGVRRDAFLFGYEARAGDWTGYCVTFASDLASSLRRQLNRSVDMQMIASTIQNREALVRDGIVHFVNG